MMVRVSIILLCRARVSEKFIFGTYYLLVLRSGRVMGFPYVLKKIRLIL